MRFQWNMYRLKRIIETYHDGKIFVKSSEENIGTTFRIAINSVPA